MTMFWKAHLQQRSAKLQHRTPVLTVRTVRFISAPLILTLWGRSTDIICLFAPITLYSVFRLLTRADKVPEVQYPQGVYNRVTHCIKCYSAALFTEYWWLLTFDIPHYCFSKLASRRNPPNPAIWLAPKAGSFLRPCPPTRAESLAAFINKFVCCLWMSKTGDF